MGFFYDEYLEAPIFEEKFSSGVIRDVLQKFLETFNIQDDSNTWFEKIKEITTEVGYTTDMKAYKAAPDTFPGNVADVSTFLRLAVTGKTNSPDLYTVMQILGYDATVSRIKNTIERLS
jgi:glutamyl/glutaminyl-tRNA synthetase